MKDNITGTVFHIIRGSFVDGWGIRTTIFLKGCPLRCIWCCNPESQLPARQLKLTPEDCTQCGLCVGICPALKLNEEGPSVDRTACNDCGKCADVCPTKALDMFGEVYTVERAFEILIRDRDYYARSGGGVTIGGGEATLQRRFTYELLKRLQAEGIHVAIDTCGYTNTPLALKILEEVDLILFDLKGMNAQRHFNDTGVSNAGIHRNLIHLGNLGKDIIIRLPLIPGHTDDNETLQQEAEFISSIGSVRRIDLIPYHEFGRIKYDQLGREYPMKGTVPLSDERLREIEAIFTATGIPTQIGG